MIYDFKCMLCQSVQTLELSIQHYMDRGNPRCPNCNIPMVRFFGDQKVGIDFSKGGSGFYKNDYKDS